MFLKDIIRDLRLKLFLTQSEIGDCVNITQASICAYENGLRKPGLKSLKRLIDFANKNGFSLEYTDIEY